MTTMKQFELWMANLNPAKGTMVGKVRPVLIVQTNLLNGHHLSTIVCPLTTNVNRELEILRVHVGKKHLEKSSDIVLDQLQTIDNRRFIKKLGTISEEQQKKVKANLMVLLDLD